MCRALQEILQSKFNDFEDPKFQSMTWFDPKNWDIEDKNYGNDQIKTLYAAFKKPLNYLKFNENVALKEWRSLKNYVKSYFRIGDDMKAFDVWQKIFKFKRVDYPNMSPLENYNFSIGV